MCSIYILLKFITRHKYVFLSYLFSGRAASRIMRACDITCALNLGAYIHSFLLRSKRSCKFYVKNVYKPPNAATINKKNLK